MSSHFLRTLVFPILSLSLSVLLFSFMFSVHFYPEQIFHPPLYHPGFFWLAVFLVCPHTLTHRVADSAVHSRTEEGTRFIIDTLGYFGGAWNGKDVLRSSSRKENLIIFTVWNLCVQRIVVKVHLKRHEIKLLSLVCTCLVSEVIVLEYISLRQWWRMRQTCLVIDLYWNIANQRS